MLDSLQAFEILLKKAREWGGDILPVPEKIKTDCQEANLTYKGQIGRAHV